MTEGGFNHKNNPVACSGYNWVHPKLVLWLFLWLNPPSKPIYGLLNQEANMQQESEYKTRLLNRLIEQPGLRGRVNAKCVECIYDPHMGNGTWRQQVEDCTSLRCPLWEIRPKSEAGAAAGA